MGRQAEDYLEIYKDIPLFQGIREEELLPMFQCLGAYIRGYKKGEFLILCEDRVKCAGVVLEGCVRMMKEDLWGSRSVLAVIRRAGLFGETFTCGTALAATVSFEAVTDVTVLYLPFDRVMRSCNMTCIFHHRLIENMVTMIADKNVQLMEKLEITSKKTLREKVTAFLSMEAQKNGCSCFEASMGRVEMAEYLCADRSALTRELKNMQKEGLIDFDKNSFKIEKLLE